MRKVILLSAAALAALGVGAYVAAADGSTAGDHVVVFEKDAGFSQTFHPGSKQFGPNSTVLENRPVFDYADGKRMGETYTRVTVVRGNEKAFIGFIDCTTTLSGGSLDFAGGAHSAQVFGKGASFAVTGGTGIYAGSRGTVFLKPVKRFAATGFELDYHLLP